MIDNVLTCLLIDVGLLTLMQPAGQRFFAAAAFTGFVLAHELVLSSSEGILYFGSAAMFDLIVIFLIRDVAAESSVALSLQRVCALSLITNAAGWALWFFYAPLILYNVAFLGIYAWALHVLTRRDRVNVGGNSLAFRVPRLRGDGFTGVIYTNKNKGEI